MPVQSNMTESLQIIYDRLGSDEFSDEPRTREFRSALKTFGKIVGRSLSEIPAEPMQIRGLLNRAPWRLHGIAERSFFNCRSRVAATLRLFGYRVDRRRNFKLSAEWEALLAPLDRRDRDELHRFGGWCSATEIPPIEVTQDVFDRFLSDIEASSLQRHPRQRAQVARRAWNRCVPGRLLTAAPVLEPPEAPAWRGHPLADFPPTLQAEVDTYINDATAYIPPLHKLKTGTKYRKEIKPVTARGYIRQLRVGASRLIDAGTPIERFGSLQDLVTPDVVRRMIELTLGDRALDETTKPTLSAIAVAALSIAKHLDCNGDSIDKLKSIHKIVRFEASGMTKRNEERLAQLEDPAALLALLTLPKKVIEDVQKAERKRRALKSAAIDVEHATAIEFLLHIPLRLETLHKLDLGAHFMRPTKPGGQWRLSVAAHDVKNGFEINALLADDLSAMLSLYVDVYRTRLVSGVSTALFPGQDCGPKNKVSMGTSIKRLIYRNTGITMNTHLFRHLAAFLHLSNVPGDYDSVREILGHKSVETTRRFYCSAKVKAAHARYDEIIRRLRAEGNNTSFRIGR